MTRFVARLLGFVIATWVLGFAAFMLLLPSPAPPETTDAVVVLTGGEGRIARGVALLAAGKARRMLISGVDRTVRPHELALTVGAPMRLFACCIDLGRGAVDTRSNARETAQWVHRHRYRSLRLVTSAWHMPRARLELRAELGDEVRILSDGLPLADPSPTLMLSEYNKFAIRLIALTLGIG